MAVDEECAAPGSVGRRAVERSVRTSIRKVKVHFIGQRGGQVVFLIDTGFNKFIYIGYNALMEHHQQCAQYGIELDFTRMGFSAQTAGGKTRVMGFGELLYSLPDGVVASVKTGVATAIAVDDTNWGSKATPLLGTAFLRKAKIKIDPEFSVAVSGSWSTAETRDGQYLMNVWEGLDEATLTGIGKLCTEKGLHAEAAARRFCEDACGATAMSAVFSETYAYVIRDETNVMILREDLDGVAHRDDEADGIEPDFGLGLGGAGGGASSSSSSNQLGQSSLQHGIELDVKKKKQKRLLPLDDDEEPDGSVFGPEPPPVRRWYCYAKIYVATTHAPAFSEEDKRAKVRTVRDLDSITTRLQRITTVGSVNRATVEQKMVSTDETHMNLLCLYYFDFEQAGSVEVGDWSGVGIPVVKKEVVKPALLQPFKRATETPTNLGLRRMASVDFGREVPLLMRGRSHIFRVDHKIEQKFRDGETGLNTRAQGEIKIMPEYLALAATIKNYLDRHKQNCAVVCGDGQRGAVAVAELVGNEIGLRKDKMPIHFGLVFGVAAHGERATSTGRRVKVGFGMASPAQDHFDFLNVTVKNDPRRTLNRRQQTIYVHLRALTKHCRGVVHPTQLAELVRKRFKGVPERDVSAAVAVAARKSLQNVRYQIWPHKYCPGTWNLVCVGAVSFLDTTFVTRTQAVHVGAVVHMVRKISNDCWAAYLGGKYKNLPAKELLNDEALAYWPPIEGSDLALAAVEPPPSVNKTADGKKKFDEAAGMPTSGAVCGFVAQNIENVGKVLVLDPGKENVSVELVMLCLGAGIRVMIVSQNSATGLAIMESAHMHLKAMLEGTSRHPFLRELPLSVLVPLCVSTRRERNQVKSYLEKGEEWRIAGKGIEPSDYHMRWWDMVEASKARVARAEHKEAAFAAAAAANLHSGLHRGLNELFQRMAEARRGFQPVENELIEFMDKNRIWKPGHYLGMGDSGTVFRTKPLGAVNTTNEVKKRNCRPVIDSETMFDMPDTVEIFATDIPHLDQICRDVQQLGYFERVRPHARRAVDGRSRLLPCTDCAEFRFVVPEFSGDVVRCCTLSPQTYCGELSDDARIADGAWVEEKKLRDDLQLQGWEPSDPLLPVEKPDGDGEREVTFADEDEMIEFDVEDEEEAAVESPTQSASEEEAEAEGTSDEDIGVNFVDITRDDFEGMLDSMTVMVNQAKVQEAATAVAAPETEAVSWTADDSVLGFPLEKGSVALCDVVERLRTKKARGAHVESEEFATLANFLSEESVKEGWARPKDLVDEISLVWGEAQARRYDGANSLHEGRTCRKFYVVPVHGLGRAQEYAFTTHLSPAVIGAVRFEFAGRFAASPGNPEEFICSVHSPGITAANRKRLRSARKLADWLPKEVIDKLELGEYASHAMLKEMKGNTKARSKEELANVLLASEEENDGKRDVLSSRFILDAKYRDELTFLLKCRWAPGGHLQTRPEEVSENSSPTVAPVQLRVMAILAGEFESVFGCIFDVPRAFNNSDPYAEGSEPLMYFPKLSGNFKRAFDDALAMLNAGKKPEEQLSADSLLKIRVPQYGLLDAAYAWYAKAKRSLIANRVRPALVSPTVYRMLDEKGEVVAYLASHVDDFLVLGNKGKPGIKKYIERRMLETFRSLEESCFSEVGDEWSAFTGKQLRIKTVDGKQCLDISLHEKINEVAYWQSDEELQGGTPDWQRKISSAELRRLRAARGSVGFAAEWIFDALYAHRTLAAGADEERTVRNASRINILIKELKETAGEGQLFVRLWMCVKKPVFLLVTDGSFQSRPVKISDDVRLDRGMAELVNMDDPEMANVKVEGLRPMTAFLLIVVDAEELADAIKHKRKLRSSLVDWNVRTFDLALGSSFGTEAVAYDAGTQHTEVVKMTMAEMKMILPSDLLEDQVLVAASELKQYDLLDSSSVIARLLNRQPGMETDQAVFKAIARSRLLQRKSGKPLVHLSDVSNLCDVGTKRFPAVNEKRHRLRELMRGSWDWLSYGGDKRGDAVGFLRGLDKREGEWSALRNDVKDEDRGLIPAEQAKTLAAGKAVPLDPETSGGSRSRTTVPGQAN